MMGAMAAEEAMVNKMVAMVNKVVVTVHRAVAMDSKAAATVSPHRHLDGRHHSRALELVQGVEQTQAQACEHHQDQHRRIVKRVCGRTLLPVSADNSYCQDSSDIKQHKITK
jgi:hypothetical protein